MNLVLCEVCKDLVEEEMLTNDVCEVCLGDKPEEERGIHIIDFIRTDTQLNQSEKDCLRLRNFKQTLDPSIWECPFGNVYLSYNKSLRYIHFIGNQVDREELLNVLAKFKHWSGE